MNFQVVWAAVQPIIMQLLQSPQFKAVVDKIWADLLAKVSAGVHPVDATTQAQGKIGAAAMLHLTGHPFADIEAFLGIAHQPPVGGPTPPPTGTYTS